MQRRTIPTLFCLAALAVAGCSNQSSAPTAATTGGSGAPAAGTAKFTIAVIPKGTTHDYWKSVDAGAEQAGKDLNVNIEWKGPLQESDRAGQIQIVQQFVADKVNGIVLAPLDDTALQQPVKSATAANIPVVIIDSALKGTAGKDFVSLVATDNYKAGAMGGQQLAKLLGGKGKVVLLRYEEGSASTGEREAGFLDVMKKTPGIQVLVDNRYGGATVGEAKTAALNLSDPLHQANGIFCPNESSTQGMLLALQQLALVGKVKFVGFDATPELVDALKKNQIDALISQNPVKMGYDGVKLMVDKLNGKTVPATEDTGAMEIDNSNLNSPDVQKLLAGH